MEKINDILEQIRSKYESGENFSELDDIIKNLQGVFEERDKGILQNNIIDEFLSFDLNRDFDKEISSIKEISVKMFGKYDYSELSSFFQKQLSMYEKNSLDFLKISGILFALNDDKVSYYRSLLSVELLSSRIAMDNDSKQSFAGLYDIFEICNECIKNGLSEEEVKNLINYYSMLDIKKNNSSDEKKDEQNNEVGILEKNVKENDSKESISSELSNVSNSVSEASVSESAEKTDVSTEQHDVVTKNNFKYYMDLFSDDAKQEVKPIEQEVPQKKETLEVATKDNSESKTDEINVAQDSFSIALDGFLADNPAVAARANKENKTVEKGDDSKRTEPVALGDFSTALNGFLADNPNVAAIGNSEETSEMNEENVDIESALSDKNNVQTEAIAWKGSVWGNDDNSLQLRTSNRFKSFLHRFEDAPDNLVVDNPDEFTRTFDSIKDEKQSKNGRKKIDRKVKRKKSKQEHISIRKKIIDKCIKILKLENEYSKSRGM